MRMGASEGEVGAGEICIEKMEHGGGIGSGRLGRVMWGGVSVGASMGVGVSVDMYGSTGVDVGREKTDGERWRAMMVDGDGRWEVVVDSE